MFLEITGTIWLRLFNAANKLGNEAVFYVLRPVCLFVINMAKEALAQDGGQRVLGPEISGLVINNDPHLISLPMETIRRFWFCVVFE